MENQVIAVQISAQAFNETMRVLQELPYKTVANVIVLLRSGLPVYAPEEKSVDTEESAAVKSKPPRRRTRL